MTIRDNGSFENVVSSEMVQKLNLKAVPHPSPYKLCWLQKRNEINVKHHCLVSFSIGNLYKDEIWCDVTHMDTCHVITIFRLTWKLKKKWRSYH